MVLVPAQVNALIEKGNAAVSSEIALEEEFLSRLPDAVYPVIKINQVAEWSPVCVPRIPS